ncbi:uncharacterized protein LOC134237904 [Saccostrea cucullata]|uniref:uncharacterized protein LOC134237904 n=1 Tax=Saccostrea cuccullata TaxID=36930 RepID=UPI002ED54DE9
MVNFCAIIGCSNTAGRDKVSFYRLPAIINNQGEKTYELSEKRRRMWLSRISRADLAPSSYPYVRICSDHFVTGKPSSLYQDCDPDWAPSKNLGHQKSQPVQPTPDRTIRIKGRVEKKKYFEAARSLISLFESRGTEDDENPPEEPEQSSELSTTNESGLSSQSELCQCGVTISTMETEVNHLTVENNSLKEQLKSTTLTEETFRKDDEKVKSFTGLPSFAVLITLYAYVESVLVQGYNSALSKFQKLILVLMRLKLNLPVHYLADKFRISSSTVSKTFLITLHAMYIKLQPLIYWPAQEERRKTMPMEFRKYFGLKVAVIIDCFELFIERPSNLEARAQTWSQYKHHNTVKFLIGISPQGVISFISNGYGGRSPDKFITNDCGFLEKLEYGDIVLADRGFDIAESLAQVSCELRIPAFTKGKSQLSALDVERTRKLAHVRIHVERVIGLVRNKYKMLQDTVPLDYLVSTEGSRPTIDKVVTVCCALTNMCKSVVPFE